MASFGVGVGDLIAVTSLCLMVYRACSSASGEFGQIKTEVENLQIALAAIDEEFPTQACMNSQTDHSQRLELHKLLENCRSLLTGIHEQLHPHAKLGTGSQSKWDSLKFSKFDLKGARSRLTAHANTINVFLSTLNAGRLRRMESKLEQVLVEARVGHRDLSAILRTEGRNSPLADHQWKILEDELVESGFSRSDIASHRHWFESLARVSSTTESEASESASLSTDPETDLLGEAVFRMKSGRMYTVRHDCTAQNNDSIRVPRGDVVESMSDLAVNVFDLNPELVCRFKHIRSSKIVLLKVSDVQEDFIPLGEGPYHALSTLSSSNARSSLHSPSQQTSVPDAPAANSSKQTPSRSQQNHTATVKSLLDRTPTRASTPQPQPNTRALASESQPLQVLRKERSRRHSTTNSIASRASSQAQSIKTEASEYDSDGRLVKSKTVTMTFGSGFFPRRNSAPLERESLGRDGWQRHDQTSSSPEDKGKMNLNPQVLTLSTRGRRSIFALSRIATAPLPAQPPAQPQISPVDSPSRAPSPPARQPTRESAFSRLSQSALINLYENRTQQLQSVMELLRKHSVIAADPFDYSVESVDSVYKEMDILDLEIAASMTRRTLTGKQKVAAFFIRRKENADLVSNGQALAEHDRKLIKGKRQSSKF